MKTLGHGILFMGDNMSAGRCHGFENSAGQLSRGSRPHPPPIGVTNTFIPASALTLAALRENLCVSRKSHRNGHLFFGQRYAKKWSIGTFVCAQNSAFRS
jgi:hypothetical protein